MVNAQFEAGDIKAAVATADDAMQTLSNDVRLAVTLATVCIHHGQTQAARNLREDADELMPNNEPIQLLLAKAGLLAGELVEALAVLKSMPKRNEKSGEKLSLMGEARALTGNLNAAAGDLLAAQKESP